MPTITETTTEQPRSVVLAKKLRELAEKTKHKNHKETLLDAARMIEHGREALRSVDAALDRNAGEMRPLWERIAVATAAPDELTTKQLLDHTAQWCEALAGSSLMEATG